MKSFLYLSLGIIYVLLSSCNSNSPKMEDKLKNIIGGNISDWKGFNANFNINKLNVIHATRSYLGVPPQEVKQIYFTIEGEERNLELFLNSDVPLCLTVNFPEIAKSEELIQKLGLPSFKQDFFLDISLVKDGKLVFLEKGITLFIDPTDLNPMIYKIKLFSPCDSVYYKQNISEELKLPEEF